MAKKKRQASPTNSESTPDVASYVKQDVAAVTEPTAQDASVSLSSGASIIAAADHDDAALASPAAPTGRPRGSHTERRPAVVFRPPHCPTCQSTRRAPFRDGPVADFIAEDRIAVVIDGATYNRELWRDTRCLDCGQAYRVIEYRFEPAADAISQEVDAISQEMAAE
jgi:hypothetical protein